MIFSKAIVKNSRSAKAQWEAVIARRNAYTVNEQAFAPQLQAAGLTVNSGIIPRDVYQDFDNVTVERMRLDDGDTFLNDLMPLSRSVNIGKLIHKYRKASGAGSAQTSMTGQTGVALDQVQYEYDGTLVPIHDTGFSRNWREWNAQQAEGFDALVDDARESTATLRKQIATSFLNGHKNKDGDFIVVDGVSWKGVTSASEARVERVPKSSTGVNIDFSSAAVSDSVLVKSMIEFRDKLWIDNKCERDLTVYTARNVYSNLERFDKDGRGFRMIDRLASIQGIADIKPTSLLGDDQMMAFPLDGISVYPVVGMGVNTVAMPRPVYNSNYTFVVWSAIGFAIKTDYDNKKCVAFFTGAA